MLARSARLALVLRPLASRPTPSLPSTLSALRFYATNHNNDHPSPPTKPTSPPPAAPSAAEKTILGDAIPPASSAASSPPQPPSDSSSTTSAAADVPAAESEATTVSRSTSSLAEQYLDLTDMGPAPEKRGFPGETTGARAKGAGTQSTIERKRQNLTRIMMLLGFVGVAGTLAVLGKDWESEEEKMKLIGRSEDKQAVAEAEEGGWKGWLARVKLRGADHLDYLNKPAWDPLLPAPLPEPHYRPYTLVLDLDDLLVHSSWDIDHGWRTAKRPGVDYFLAYLSQFYEIVLFTTQPAYTAAPIVEKIDPYGAYIPWKLFRESTRYKNKTLIKDLSYLGRPLERTIILDTDPSHFQLQPDNGIALAPWRGTRGDETAKELISLIPFLEALAIKGVKDVRPVIKHYKGKHIPTAYAEAEAASKKALVDKWEQDKKGATGVAGWISTALGSLVKSQSRETPPETDVEKVRKNAQRMYLEEQKYWKDNEEMIKKQMEEDREKQLKEMKGSLLGFMGLAPPEQQQSKQ